MQSSWPRRDWQFSCTTCCRDFEEEEETWNICQDSVSHYLESFIQVISCNGGLQSASGLVLSEEVCALSEPAGESHRHGALLCLLFFWEDSIT